MQPLWSGNTLSFVSDRTDWWNIYTEGADGKVPHISSHLMCPQPPLCPR